MFGNKRQVYSRENNIRHVTSAVAHKIITKVFFL